MSVSITKDCGPYRSTLGRFDYEWKIAIRNLPDDAPAPFIEEFWPEGQEPLFSDLTPPSVIAEEIECRAKRKNRISKIQETLDWIKENADVVNYAWAEKEIQIREKGIAKLNKEINNLKTAFIEPLNSYLEE